MVLGAEIVEFLVGNFFTANTALYNQVGAFASREGMISIDPYREAKFEVSPHIHLKPKFRNLPEYL